MQKLRRFLSIVVLISLIVTTGCAIGLGPELVPLGRPAREPVVRLGEVTEALTGTWTSDPGAGTSAFRGPLVEALGKPEAKAYFRESAPLTLDIHLTSDHLSDQPRLGNLGLLSMATFGVIPLSYFSEWNVTCDVKVSQPDSTVVADYVFHERGTYKIWALPVTMFTLLGAGIRGESDWWNIANRVANNLAVQILQAVDTDYPKLSSKAGVGRTPGTEPYAEPPKPLIL